MSEGRGEVGDRWSMAYLESERRRKQTSLMMEKTKRL